MLARRAPVDQCRWFPCVNDAAEAVPAFAAMQYSFPLDQATGRNDVLHVGKPSADGQPVVINGPTPIPAGGSGVCSLDPIVFAAIDPVDFVSPYVGSKAGSWLLAGGYFGFEEISPVPPGPAFPRTRWLRRITSTCGRAAAFDLDSSYLKWQAIDDPWGHFGNVNLPGDDLRRIRARSAGNYSVTCSVAFRCNGDVPDYDVGATLVKNGTQYITGGNQTLGVYSVIYRTNPPFPPGLDNDHIVTTLLRQFSRTAVQLQAHVRLAADDYLMVQYRGTTPIVQLDFAASMATMARVGP